MKSLILGLSFLLSAQAFATGSVYCSTPAKEYEFSGTTGRVAGNPLIDGMLVNTDEETQTFSNSRIVGYWNMGETLKFAIADDQFSNLLYSVEAKFVYSDEGPSYVGVLTLASGEFFLVECEM